LPLSGDESMDANSVRTLPRTRGATRIRSSHGALYSGDRAHRHCPLGRSRVQDTLPLPSPQPSLVGRDDQLATLRAGMAAGLPRHGRLVLISGVAGIGKTALAAALCREAAAAGVHVLTGHCYDRMETPPYGPWIEIVGQVPVLPNVAQVPPVPSLAGA